MLVMVVVGSRRYWSTHVLLQMGSVHSMNDSNFPFLVVLCEKVMVNGLVSCVPRRRHAAHGSLSTRSRAAYGGIEARVR